MLNAESEQQYRQLFDCNPHPMWIFDAETLKFLAVNDAAVYQYGYTREEFLGITIRDIRPPEEIPKLLADVAAGHIGHDLAGIWKHRRKDSTVFEVDLVSHELTWNGRPAKLVMALDITERRRSEQALRRNQQLLQNIVDNSATVIYVKDMEGHYLLVNRRFGEVFGFAQEDVIGKTDQEIFPEEIAVAFRTMDEKVVAAGHALTDEETAPQDDGMHTYLSVKCPLRDTAGKPYAVFGISTDITERKRAEEAQAKLEDQLRQAQKMESVGRLAGGIAHDFNNLLNVIIGYSEIGMLKISGDDRLRGQLLEIKKAGARAADLTRQLLVFSRKQVIEPKVFDLNTAIADLSRMLERLIGEDIRLVMLLSNKPARIKADRGQIEQIIMNLVVNSRDAMPSGGRLTIETSNVSLDDIYARGHFPVVPGRYVMMAVSDSGIGMDGETQRHIFDPFFTTKEQGKGTGLGLSTVYGIVKQSGGYIWVYSEVNKGATFKVYLPRVEEAEESIPKTKATRVLEGTETILLVEDEPGIRELTQECLASKGYKILAASDAPEALTLAGQHAEPIDLLLTDVVLPSLGGPELASQLRAVHPEMRVLYMSGYTDDAIVHHGVLQPGTAFLQKPFTIDDLWRRVREVFDSPAS